MVGFVTGGIGLGIYLRSFIDVLISILLFVSCQHAQVLGWALGPDPARAHNGSRDERHPGDR